MITGFTVIQFKIWKHINALQSKKLKLIIEENMNMIWKICDCKVIWNFPHIYLRLCLLLTIGYVENVYYDSLCDHKDVC